MDGITTRDDAFMLIALGELYVDISAAPLVESDNVRVFPDSDTATAYEHLIQTSAQMRANIQKLVHVAIGSPFQWDGKGWIIVNLGETSIGLIDDGKAFTELPLNAFEKLVQEGRIIGLTLNGPSSVHPEVTRRIVQASRQDYEKANHLYQIVQAHIQGEPLPSDVHLSERTLRHWVALYRRAEDSYGNGYVGLLPQRRTGNTTDKLPLLTRTLLKEFIENDYETIKNKREFEVYAVYSLVCKKHGVLSASYKTFCKAVKSRPRYAQTKNRQGSIADCS